MSVSNFAKNTLKSAIGSGATSIDIDTATSPYNNMPSSGRGFLKDSLDSPTKWEEITWTGRSAITGGYTLTGVTRNVDSNTGAAQAFDAGHFITQDPSGTNKVVTDEAQTFTALQTFSSGINLGNSNLTTYDQDKTFTPVLKGTTTTGTNSYSSQLGRYQIVGNAVHFWLRVQLDGTAGALDSTGNLYIDGLPFSSVLGFDVRKICSIVCITGMSIGSGETLKAWVSSNGSSRIEILRETTTGRSFFNDTHGTDSLWLEVTGAYES